MGSRGTSSLLVALACVYSSHNNSNICRNNNNNTCRNKNNNTCLNNNNNLCRNNNNFDTTTTAATSTTTVKLLGSANVGNIDRPITASHQDDNTNIQTGQYRTGEWSDRATRFSEWRINWCQQGPPSPLQ